MDNLSGKIITLRPLRDEDFEYIASLKNDTRTQARGFRLPPNFTAARTMEEMRRSYGRPNRGAWAIETKAGKLVGFIDYIEGPPRFAASMGVATGVEHWGKGYAEEAMELIMRFLFEERGLQTVSLWTTSWNERMVGLAQKLGFKIAVCEREARFLEGQNYDGLMMDILREEYYASRGLKDELPPGPPAGG